MASSLTTVSIDEARGVAESDAGWRAQEEWQRDLKPKVARGEEEAACEREPVEVWVVGDEDVAPLCILLAAWRRDEMVSRGQGE